MPPLAEARRPPRVSPRDIVHANLCIGCGACAGPGGAGGSRMSMDRDGQLRPAADTDRFAWKGAGFGRICPFSPAARDETRIAQDRFPAAARIDDRVGRFEAAYVGHVTEA